MTALAIPDILNKAAELIEEHGLGKGEFIGLDGCLCAYGAIRAAAVGKVEPSPNMAPDQSLAFSIAGIRLADYLIEKNLLSLDEDIPSWNDAEDRTQQEVVDALRAAAQVLA